MKWQLVIADDEKHIREGMRAIVSEMDLALELVGVASNGQEVLELVEQHAVQIFILDINMPRLSGLELIRELQAREKERFEVLILSGYDDFAYAKEAVQLQVGAYLLKPVDEEELYDSLKKAIWRLEKARKSEEYLHQLKRYLAYEDAPEETFSLLVRDAMHLIEQHFSEVDWDLNAAAKELNCHPDYLSKRLKQETQFTFTEQLSAMRLQAALDLLRSNEYTISEIAWRVGFSNAQYFSTVFKNHFSVTPKNFYPR